MMISAQRRLRMVAGTRPRFVVRDDGKLEAIPMAGSLKSLKGVAPKPKKALTPAEIDAAAFEGACRGALKKKNAADSMTQGKEN